MTFIRQNLTGLLVGSLLLLPSGASAHLNKHQRGLGFVDCITDCIESSGCSAADVKCMCRAAQGSFLAQVATCMYTDCSQAMSIDTITNPLGLACDIIGNPIPDSAISSAEAAQSSAYDHKPTTTIVVSATTTVKTTYSATSKVTTATSTSTSTTDSATRTTTSLPNSGDGGVTSSTVSLPSASTSTDAHLSSGTSTQTLSDTVTTTATAVAGDPTDSSPFATPRVSSGNRDASSLLSAAIALAAVLLFA